MLLLRHVPGPPPRPMLVMLVRLETLNVMIYMELQCVELLRSVYIRPVNVSVLVPREISTQWSKYLPQRTHCPIYLAALLVGLRTANPCRKLISCPFERL